MKQRKVIKSTGLTKPLAEYEPGLTIRWFCKSCGRRIKKKVWKVIDPYEQMESFKWKKDGMHIKFFGYCCKFCYDIRKLRNDR